MAARSLRGIFAVYKPPAVNWRSVRLTVETGLVHDLNASECPLPHDQIRFLPTTSQGISGTETNLTVAQLPALANHPRVRGPKFVGLRIGAGHRLDWRSSGVFDHITLDRLERIIAVIQGSHQKALITYSGIDLKSQAAYELACRGMLRPLHKSPPIITGIRCSQFSLPNFTLEVQCVHETQQYLRKIIHEIGLELKSSAVCTSVRRTRDGVFTLDDALIRTDWKLQQISSAVRRSQPRVAAALREDSWRHTALSGMAVPERCPVPTEAEP
ncbi:mitochondrial mRNA pseudouridine synthase TRUB2 isoform X3 [Amblyraja radiata]|uniref:mitochondrial mRNA pseudouridine synthase TRUB2 isoform X3 n=1 Tax=Amblyraja radiata TaxID=386614 RepID=UPI0014039A78|nr:mitochondrial mRNA pseudouridine synthase TRUB2 isoform X3 [Amblyraja radiata]